jgi:DNA-binding MarR family transcriptional regulator
MGRRKARNDPAPDPRDFEVPFIGHRLRETYNAWVRRSEKEFAQFGITTTMSLVLIRLWLEEAITQKELVEHTALMQSGTSSVLKRLIRQGFIVGKAGLTDGREMRYSLTPKGEALVLKVAPVALDIRKRALQGLDPKDVRQVQEILGHIKGNLGS